MHTILLNDSTGCESLNSLYTVHTTTSLLAHMEDFNSKHAAGETIKSVYKFPSLARAFRYLHAAAVFPTESTCFKSIRNGNYLTLPLLTIYNVNRHFSDSEGTQKGHMRNQRQRVCSTKAKSPHPGTESPPAEKNMISSSMCINPRGPYTNNKRESYLTSRFGETDTN